MFFFSQNKLIVDTNFFIVTCIEMYTDKSFVKLSNRTGCPSGSFGMDCGGLCSDKCKTRGQCEPVIALADVLGTGKEISVPSVSIFSYRLDTVFYIWPYLFFV